MSRVVEIIVISGEGLRINGRQVAKKNVFVVVRTDDKGYAKTNKVDAEDRCFHAWNEKLMIDVPVHARFITVEVHQQCGKRRSGSKIIGTASILVSDFLGGFVPENYLHFLSYRLRDRSGERNGIINLSAKVLKGPANVACYASEGYSSPWAAGAPTSGKVSGPMSGKVSGGVVTGVPVLCAYRT